MERLTGSKEIKKEVLVIVLGRTFSIIFLNSSIQQIQSVCQVVYIY